MANARALLLPLSRWSSALQNVPKMVQKVEMHDNKLSSCRAPEHPEVDTAPLVVLQVYNTDKTDKQKSSSLRFS